MSRETVLIELVDRVGASPDQTIRIDSRELAGWPDDSVAALKTQQLIRKTRPATSTVCPGCEQQCMMPVHTVVSHARPSTGRTDRSSSFIVCDKREDINRVPVERDRLSRWVCNTASLGDFVAECLRLRPKRNRIRRAGLLQIGMAADKKRRQMICLRTHDGELELAAGSGAIALADVLRFRAGRFRLENTLVRQLVDASMTGDPRYTPSHTRREARKLATRARDQAIRKAYRKLKRERPGMSDVWYAQQLAKRTIGGGLSPETIRKKLKK